MKSKFKVGDKVRHKGEDTEVAYAKIDDDGVADYIVEYSLGWTGKNSEEKFGLDKDKFYYWVGDEDLSPVESDKRRFSTGAIRDNDDTKEDYIEGVSWLALKRYASYMSGKAVRYGKGNWKKGIPPQAYIESLARHFQKFVSEWEYGICKEKEDHLSAMMFNLTGLMHELEMVKEGNGRFEISENYAKLYDVEAKDES